MIERHVYLEIESNDSSQNFSVERWFLPLDSREESWTGVALVFGEKVVLCSRKRASDIWSAISEASAKPYPTG